MRNKVLIVTGDPETFEQMLQEVADQGGELIFAKSREEGLAALHQEKPQLIFLESALIGKEEDVWVSSGAHIVVVRPEGQVCQRSEDCVVRPLSQDLLLQKCREALGTEVSPPMPPM